MNTGEIKSPLRVNKMFKKNTKKTQCFSVYKGQLINRGEAGHNMGGKRVNKVDHIKSAV